MQKNKKLLLIIFLLVFIFLFILSVIFALININNENILNGILIGGIDVSGMSIETAQNVILENITNKKQEDIKIIIPENEDTYINLDDLKINYNINSSIDEAFNIGRSENIFKNNFDILKLKLHKKNINLKFEFDEEKLNSIISDLSSNIKTSAVPNSYYIEENQLIITPGIKGNGIDLDDFKFKLNNLLNNASSKINSIETKLIEISPEEIDIDKIYNEIYKDPKNAYYEEEPFKVYPEVIGISFDKDIAYSLLQSKQEEYIIPLKITPPEITTADLNINIFHDILSNFTTKYDLSNTDRTTNLELAASKIDGCILSPGEEFSYNKIVGARTISAGYKEAKIYSNGEVVDGVGGGICQISSTLYNAVFYANLDVTERHNHQFITSYVPAGRDATVVYGSKDFKFVNNRTYPIKITCTVKNGIVACSISGIKEDSEYKVDFDIETVSKTAPQIKYEHSSSIEKGTEIIKQKGSTGSTVDVYKVLKLNGAIVSKAFQYQDTYNALEKIILTN